MAAPFWQQAARQMGGFQGSPVFAALQGSRIAAAPHRRQSSYLEPYVTPEEEASALRKAGSMAVGGISMASAALDVPGGAIRNILSGRAPSVNPLSWEGRTTGRELLEQWGAVGPNRPGFIAPGGQWYDPRDWDWGDIAGLGTEIALDPWTYFSFGGAAVSRAGKAMKMAGLWDFLPGAAAKAGVKGRMAMRQQMTPRMVLKELPKKLQMLAAKKFALQARQQGVRAATLADEPLGGAARFWPTGGVVGKAGGVGGKVAAALDPVGEAIRYGKYSPVRPAYAAFSKLLKGQMRADVQRKLAAAHAETKFAEHQIEQETLVRLSKLKEGGHLSPEGIRAARQRVEGFTDDLPPGANRDAAETVRSEAKELLQSDIDMGLNTPALDDIADYGARRRAEFYGEGAWPEERKFLGQPAVLSAKHASQRSRADYLRNWELGTVSINRASLDSAISGTAERTVLGRNLSSQTSEIFAELARRQNRATTEQIKRRLQKYIPKAHRAGGNLDDLARHLKGLDADDAAEYLWENYKTVLPEDIDGPEKLTDMFYIPKSEAREIVRDWYPRTSAKGVDLDAAVRHLRKEYWDVLPEDITDEKLYELATRLSQLSHRHVLTGTPLFPHHPALDHHRRKILSLHAQSSARVIYDMLADGAEHADDMSVRLATGKDFAIARTSVADALDRAGLVGERAEQQMLSRLPEKMKKWRELVKPSDRTLLKNVYVDQRMADDLAALGKFYSDPQMHLTVETGLGAAWDTALQFFKGHVTAYWPAFISRNFFSGQIQNQIGGVYNLNPFARDGMVASVRDIIYALHGENIPNILEIPMVRAARITDPREATRYVLSALAAGQLGGRYQMEHAPRLAASTARSAEEMLSAIPGAVPTDFWGWLPRNWESLKPWAMRGVGGRERSQFFLSKFGEDMGYFTESLNRFAPALAMLRRGVDPMAAVDRIKLLQVDYLAQAVGDKYMRRAVPFWSFVSRQSKYLATELSQRPGGPLAQVIRGEAAMQREGLPPALPEHIRQTAAIPLGEAVGGGTNILTSLGMMHEDPLQFLGGVPTRGIGKAIRSIGTTFGQEALGRLGPIPSAAIELPLGVSTWQAGPRGGRRIMEQYGHVAGLLKQATGKQWNIPPIIEQIPQVLGAGRWLSSASKFTDPRKTARQKAVNLLTGAHLTTVSPEQQERVIQKSVDEMMADLGARQFEKPYFPDWFMAGLSSEEQQKRREVESLRKALDRRRRERRARETATQP